MGTPRPDIKKTIILTVSCDAQQDKLTHGKLTNLVAGFEGTRRNKSDSSPRHHRPGPTILFIVVINVF